MIKKNKVCPAQTETEAGLGAAEFLLLISFSGRSRVSCPAGGVLNTFLWFFDVTPVPPCGDFNEVTHTTSP